MSHLYTPVQRRMLKILSDGLPHTKLELHGCLCDDLGPVNNVQMHISAIRAKIRPSGFDVTCVRDNGHSLYQMVRALASANDGKR